MTQIKHTPGPWTAQHNGEYTNISRENYDDVIAEVCFPDYQSHDTHIANVRLITAAPEMYDALRAIADARDYAAENDGAYPFGTLADDQCFDDWAADLASAAIAKVTA